MESLNRKLALAAIVLLALSAGTYWNGITRADRFESGQKFLPNLNPDEVGDIRIQSGEASVTLERDAGAKLKDQYTVAEEGDYAAKNESVNGVLRALLDLELAKEVGASDSLAEELGIEPAASDAIDVTLENQSGQEMVRLRFGNRAEDGNGRYVRRLDTDDAPIFLTTSAPNIQTGSNSYLRKEIVDVESAEVQRIEGPDFVLEIPEEGTELALVDASASEEVVSSKLSQVKSALSRLSFDKVFLADDPEVASLEWRRALRVTLGDESGYAAMIAEVPGDGDDEVRRFVRLSSFLGVDRIELSGEEDEEELKDKSKILKRNDEVQQFNAYHGSWVYELPTVAGEKLAMRRAGLLSED